jgi:hypothetical protein
MSVTYPSHRFDVSRPMMVTLLDGARYAPPCRHSGLVLYATTGALVGGLENHVGTWSMSPGLDYQVPATCTNVVTHASPQPKALHSKFYFTAPAGTGRVTFRVLLKQGGQGRGAFYYPKVPLALGEGPAPPASASRVIVGAAGAACAEVCSATPSAPYCDGATIRGTDLAAKLQAQVSAQVMCNTALLAACPYAGGPQVTAAGYCTYVSPSVTASCPAAYLPTAANPPTHLPDPCYTHAARSSRPICVCSSDVKVRTVNPFKQALAHDPPLLPVPTLLFIAPGQYQVSAAAPAAKPSSSIALAVAVSLAAVVASSASLRHSSARVALLLGGALALLALVAQPTEAHNFVSSTCACADMHVHTCACKMLPMMLHRSHSIRVAARIPALLCSHRASPPPP